MFRNLCTCVAGALLLCSSSALPAQDVAVTSSPVSVVPHVVKYSGTLPDAPAAASIVEVKFAMYSAQTGGEPVWQETQQVALDAQSKYSVLLGATAAAGLPHDLFANGDPRWLGVTIAGQTETPRTLLAATAYSLKASDAETLGGHPASDFALLRNEPNGKPNTLTDVSTIKGSNGILVNNMVNGSGTGPTVNLALDGTFLGTLGNKYYAQLAAANTFTTNQAIHGNLSLTGDITINGTIYSTYLDTLSTQVPTLKGNNNFSGTNTFAGAAATQLTVTTTNSTGISSTGGTYAVYGQSTTGFGLYGTSLSGTGVYGSGSTADTAKPGVFGTGETGVWGDGSYYGVYGNASTYGGYFIGTDYGIYAGGTQAVYAFSPAGNAGYGVVSYGDYGIYGEGYLGTSYGVYGGNSAKSAGYGVEGYATDAEGGTGVFGYIGKLSTLSATTSAGSGVWGDAPAGAAVGGVLGTTDDNWGGSFFSNGSSYETLYVDNVFTPGASAQTASFNGTAGECEIDGAGDLTCSGTVSPSVAHTDGRSVAMYSPAATENWFEDYGSGHLAHGEATVTLDHDFADLVNTGVEYHVFLTPNGDSKGLYIASKGTNAFVVREQGGGTATIAFDYKVVAKRKGFEQMRMTDRTAVAASHKAARETKLAAMQAHPHSLTEQKRPAAAPAAAPMIMKPRQQPGLAKIAAVK